MGKAEEVQEKVKADMEAMKEKMATMMEAMMSMKKIMEANAVTIAATSTVAKVNPMPPSSLNQMNHPTSAMVGKIWEVRAAPMMCKSKTSTPSRHMACLSTIHHPMWRTLPIRMSIIPLLYPLRANNPKLIMHIYATKGQAVGGIPLQNTLEGPQYHPQLHLLHSTKSKTPHAMAEMGKWRTWQLKWHLNDEKNDDNDSRHITSILLWKMVDYTPSSFADLVFAGEMIEVEANLIIFEEDEKEGETYVVTAILIRPSFPPTQQCHYSANNNPSHYPPLKKPVEFTPIPVSYANLLPYLLDNSMVAITPAKVHQPPFLREYDSNTTCACHGEALGRSIKHCRALKRKVDPWVLVPITFRGLYVLAIRGLTSSPAEGCTPSPLEGYASSSFALRCFTETCAPVPGPPPNIRVQPTVRAHPEREAITHLLCILGQDFTRAAAKRRVWIMRTNMTTFTWIWMTLLFSNILPGDHNANLPLQMYRLVFADMTYVRIAPKRRPVDPKKSNRALGFLALVTSLCQSYRVPFPPARSCHRDIGKGHARKTLGGHEEVRQVLELPALITGLCQFYGVPVAPSKVISPPTNRAFIKNGRQRRRGEGRRHPLGNKPWKKELHLQDEPWIRSLEGCFNGGKERGRERERGEHEIEGIKEGEKCLKNSVKISAQNSKHVTSILLWKMVGYTPSSFADSVFIGEMIEVGLKRGKSDHFDLINAKKKKLGQSSTKAIPKIKPQSLPTALPMTNTTFSINQNTNQEMNFAARKPVEFTPIPVSYADLLPYLLDNSMVAITPTKVHQPPFLREYDSNATCACHGEAPGHSIEHCRALKLKVQGLIDAGCLKFEENHVFPTSRVQSCWMTDPLDESISCFLIKVDPWVLVPITFRGLYVLAIRGLHILACRGLHALAFRRLRVLVFSVLHIHTLREYKSLGHPLILEGDQLCEHIQRGRLSRIYYASRGNFTRATAKRRVRIMRTNMTTLSWIWMTSLFSNILPSDHNANLPLQMDRAHKTPSGLEEVQQGPGVSSSGGGPRSVLQGAHSPSEVSIHMVQRISDTIYCLQESHPQRHSVNPEKSNRFYGVPVAPSKVIRPPTNRTFIKKYCVPRQAQDDTPQQPGDGRQQATDAPPSPLEFTSAHPQKG
ncbi:hypothetical protein HKD37_06G016695 [Glycine soja]